MTELLESLSTDHREVERLFTTFASDGDDATARQICDALTLHAEVEEQVLYPEVRRIVDDGDDLVNDAENEHGAARALIARVDEAPPPDLEPLMNEMRAMVEEHVHSEESSLFSKLREAGVTHSFREGAIRLSPHAYNTSAEIDYALGVIAP